MPYNQRGQMKREADQAIASIEKCASYLLRWRSEYDPDYPEYVTAIDAMLGVLVGFEDALEQFASQI